MTADLLVCGACRSISRVLSPARSLQTIHSARANAVNNFGLNPSKLVIGAPP